MTFSNNTWFHVETCCNCHVQFAMTDALYKRRREDKASFYCPNGHAQHYTGPNEATRLREELARKEQMLDAANARAEEQHRQKTHYLKAHRKMRVRVMNGVCPCCNRTFENLMRHMRTQHPDFGGMRSLQTLRTAFGMTQSDVAEEAGVTAVYVSLYERDKALPKYARERIDGWLESHTMLQSDEPAAAQADRTKGAG